MNRLITIVVTAVVLLIVLSETGFTSAVTAGAPTRGKLVIAADGRSSAMIVVSPTAGKWEKRAAADLVRYVELMSGAKVSLANTASAIEKAMQGDTPLLIVGQQALAAEPDLGIALEKVAKKDPVLRADAIAVKRKGNRVYLAGLTDDGHYHAVTYLLHQWGCRWYLPTSFGQCIPEHKTLKIGKLDHAYAAPFERRSYWISWNGARGVPDGEMEKFNARNFMTFNVPTPGIGHALSQYTRDLVEEGKSGHPIAEEKTIAHVAAKLDETFRNSGGPSLAMEDSTYHSDSPVDRRLQAGLYDKYFMAPNMTDVFMTLYNGVCDRLLDKYPDSKAMIGFLALHEHDAAAAAGETRRRASSLCLGADRHRSDPWHGRPALAAAPGIPRHAVSLVEGDGWPHRHL